MMGLRRQERAGRFLTVILNMRRLAAALDKEAEEQETPVVVISKGAVENQWTVE